MAAVHPSSDGVIRRATVRAVGRAPGEVVTLERPANKLIPILQAERREAVPPPGEEETRDLELPGPSRQGMTGAVTPSHGGTPAAGGRLTQDEPEAVSARLRRSQ